MLKGLQYIHSMSLVHLDIKPENIFISSREPSLDTSQSTMEAIAEEPKVYKIGTDVV